MRRVAIALVSAGLMALPAFAAARSGPATEMVTVAELEQALKLGGRDGELADRIARMRLTERLSSVRLTALLEQVRGAQAREALTAVADESALLGLPTGEMPAQAAPDAEEQRTLLEKSVDYVKNTVAHWPSFAAVRTATRFEGTATVIPGSLADDMASVYGRAWLRSPAAEDWECPGKAKLGGRRLDVIERSTAPVLYRHGHAVRAMDAGGEFACAEEGMNAADELGEMAVLVPLVVKDARVTWSHWEQGPLGLVAVFHYGATIKFNDTMGTRLRPATLDMEGEMAVNRRDGGVVRLTAARRWVEKGFAKEFDTAVEYGPVAMGGALYLCPMRRVAIYRAPFLRPRDWKQMEPVYRKFALSESPLQEYLNEVRFGEYAVAGR